MAFPTKDGAKSFGSKFRASRYDRENSNPDEGNRAKANELSGKDEHPDADSRLHNNPHPEKFNTPLHGPGANPTEQESGARQAEAQEQSTVKCPECGADVPMGGGEPDQHHDNGMSETEEDVQHDKVAKGVWKPGQREHPDAEAPDADDFEVEPL